ncbi:hypothetical protein C8A05DRAFT_14483 [Staphylotrichum tortipilum]|uniref:Infection structure specific protein n=1 Tax=Staphylotrichum tortipilum TaxID=2831512 RepID=A0AAN6MMB7_9PEZI|nr:hypothetical protein C8A05DRAFT_14483 [Staphylotrichum longicolle]
MRSPAILLPALAATAAANAVLIPAHVPANAAAIQARQTNEAEANKCLDKFMSVYASQPTGAPEFVAYQQSHPLTDFCHYSVPASLDAAFTEYGSMVKTWVDANIKQISSLVSDCPIYSGLTSSPSCWLTTAKATPTPSAGSGGAGAASNATTTRSGGAASSSTGAPTPTGNAATRETGAMLAAAIAAVGVLGAVAAL